MLDHPEAAAGPNRQTGSRRNVILFIGLPVLLIAVILIWGVVQTGGESGRPGVNDTFGSVDIDPNAAADFTLTLFDGTDLRLSDLRGKVVMIDFWGSWCPPCRAEAPTLQQVHQEYEDMPVEFVGIDIWDTEKDARAYIERFGITFPSGLDEKGFIAVEYGVKGLPEKIFVTPEGIISKKFIGPMKADKLRGILDEEIEKAFPPESTLKAG